LETPFKCCPQQAAGNIRFNPVDAQFQEELCESGKRFFTQIAATVEIVSAAPIAVGEMIIVLAHVAGETACDGPYSAGIQNIEESCVGNQPCDTPVAVEKRVYHSKR
jgi:hypothetical protein